MYETLDNSLLITQAYSANLGLFKLTANGDSIKSLISNQNFVARSSDYNPNKGKLYVVSNDKKILCFDSSLNLKWNKSIAASSFNSSNLIKIISDSTLCIGGKYSNEASLLYTDTQAVVKKSFNKRFFYSTPSTIVGFFNIKQQLVSLSYPGYAVTQHNYDLNNACFNAVNGSVFTTSTNTLLTFKAHVKIRGAAAWDEWKDIVAIKTMNANPTANCKSFDIGVQPEKSNYFKACRNVPIRVYITNHGTTNITKISYRIYAEGKEYDSTLNFSALGSKSSAFYTLKTLYLNSGARLVTGKILKINDQTDEFVLNDSFAMTFIGKTSYNLKLSEDDTLCAGETALITSNGKPGNYSWYRNNALLKQGTENYVNTINAGIYYTVVLDSGCLLYSDTAQLTIVPKPSKPNITENAGILTTDAQNQFYWYFKNQLIDSNKISINIKGAGDYKVIAINQYGCKNESSVFNYSAGINTFFLQSLLLNISNSLLQWNGKEPSRITIFTSDGKTVQDLILNPKEQITNLQPGIYFVKVWDRIGYVGVKRIWIKE